MSVIKSISLEESMAYIDLFCRERELAIDSPFHYLVLNEDLSQFCLAT